MIDNKKRIAVERYWLKKLSGDPPKISLPLFSGDTARKETSKETLHIDVPDKLAMKLEEIGGGSDKALFIIFLSAMNILFYKYTGVEDLVIGTVSPQSEGQKAGVVFCRSSVTGDITFKEVLQQTRQVVLEALNYSDYSFGMLYQKLLANSKKENLDIFNVAFIFKSLQEKSRSLNIFDLLFILSRQENRLALTVEFNTALYSHEVVERFCRNLFHVFLQAVEFSSRGIAQIDAVCADEVRELLAFNPPPVEYPFDKTLHELFEAQVLRTPHHVAVVGCGTGAHWANHAITCNRETGVQHLTYLELNRRADQLARMLQERGVRPGTIVAVMLDRSIEMLIGLLGILKAGGAYLPIDKEYPPERRAYVLADSNTNILVSEGIDILDPERRDKIPTGASGFAYVLYTSGTTGRPKGVAVRHRNLLAYINTFLREFPLSQKDIVLQQASYSFDAFVEEVYPALLSGGRVLVLPKHEIVDVDILKERIARHGVTMISCSPLLLNELNKINVPRDVHPLRSIHTFISGGDVLKKEYINRLLTFGNVYNTYGPTETTVCATYFRCSSPLPDNIPIGTPITNYGVYILDASYRPVPMGVAGELCISGAGVTAGYLNRPELSAEKFNQDFQDYHDDQDKKTKVFGSPEPFFQKGFWPPEAYRRLYRTGDRARWLPGGILEFLGRVDRQIQLRGFRIEPGEIENRLLNHEGIETAIVTSRTDKTGETSLCAYIVTHSGIDEQELRASLARVLPDYMIPAFFVELDRLPFSTHGKLDRDALPDPVGRIRGITYVSRQRMERLSADLEKIRSSSPVCVENETTAPGFGCYIIGETALAVRCAEILLDRGHRVHGIVSGDSRVLEWARTRGIAFMNQNGSDASRKAGLVTFFKQVPFDYLFSIYSTRILPDEILTLPRKYAVNFHDAPLPRYAGLHVPSWALINREKTHGITWHVVDSGVDTGDILEQVTFPVEDRETAFSLNMKCIDAGARVFEGLVDRSAQQKEIRQKQDLSERTYYGKYQRPFAGGLISFSEEAGAIEALVRGLDFGVYENPLGMPKIVVEGNFYIVTAVTLPDVPSLREPGTVVAVKEDSLVIAAVGGDVEISGLLTTGGETVTMADFVRRWDIREGYRFPEMPQEQVRRLDEYYTKISKHEKFWVRRVYRCRPLRLAHGNGETAVRLFTIPAVVDSPVQLKDRLIAAFVFSLSRLTCIDSFDIGYSDTVLRENIRGLEGMFAPFVPLRIQVDGATSAADFSLSMQKELLRVRKHQTYSRDLLLRFPLTAAVPERDFAVRVLQVERLDDLAEVGVTHAPQLQLVIAGEGRETLLKYDTLCLDEDAVQRLLHHVSLFLQGETFPSEPLLKGSIDRRVQIGNMQVDPEEIETLLAAHEDVNRAAVVVKRHGNPGSKETYLCACLESEKRLTEPLLRAHLSRYIPLRRQPSHFLQLEKMPLSTTHGEIDRTLLEQVDLRISTGGEVRGPRDETEEELTRLWIDVLGVSTGIDANFFESGGHSLKATVLLNRVRKVLDVKIPLAEMFKTPTIRGLSEYVKRELRRPTRNSAYAAVEPAPPAEYYPLSSAQKRNYVLSQVDKDNLVYNMTEAVIIHGLLDTARFEETFRKLIRRHESFRTSFEIVDGEPKQKIHEHVEFHLSLDPGEEKDFPRSITVEEIVKDFVRPFDLSHAPLFRARLARMDEHKHILVVDMHHIISDGTSVAILIRDFTAIYAGEELPPLRIQYKDFAWHQNSRKESLALKKQEEYWLKTFSGQPAVLDLPLDYERPQRQSFEGGVLTFELDSETTDTLKKLAAQEGATLFMILLTIVYIWLWKLSRSETIVVGSPIAGRRHADQEGIIGMFVNSLALKNSPRPGKSFKEFLKEVAHNTLEAYENQEYQFEDLVEKIMNGRLPGRHPVFDVMFALQNLDIPQITVPGLTFDVYGHAHNVSPFDLWMTAEERGSGLAFKFGYSIKLFREESARNFILYFREIVDTVKERQDILLKDIKMSHRLLEPGIDMIGGLDEDFGF